MFFPTSSNFLHTIIPTTILENQDQQENDNIILESMMKKCISNGTIWYKMGILSYKLDENEHPHTATCQCCKKGIKVQNDLKEFHEEMREIQPLANAATQRRKK
ncbi:hypothetical protein Tco_0535763 [Tanacetum coccineum]